MLLLYLLIAISYWCWLYYNNWELVLYIVSNHLNKDKMSWRRMMMKTSSRPSLRMRASISNWSRLRCKIKKIKIRFHQSILQRQSLTKILMTLRSKIMRKRNRRNRHRDRSNPRSSMFQARVSLRRRMRMRRWTTTMTTMEQIKTTTSTLLRSSE